MHNWIVDFELVSSIVSELRDVMNIVKIECSKFFLYCIIKV